MSIPLALHDAAKNCAEHGGVITITLKGSAQLVGYLKHPAGGSFHMETTGMVETERGWATFLVSEVAAVGAEPR